MSNNAIHTSRRPLVLIASVAFLWLTGLCHADAGLQPHRASSGLFSRADVDSLEAATTLLREVLQSVHEVYVDRIPVEELLEAALGGIEEHLDAYTRLLTPEEYRSLRSQTGAAVGIGLELDVSRPIPRVCEVATGSPAEAAGLRPGDQLIEIDGVATEDMDESDIKKFLRGQEGSRVMLKIASPREEARTLELTRTLVREAPVDTLRIKGNSIGYVRLRRFARNSSITLEAILRHWSAQGIEGLIIDLRGNPGGYLDEGIRAADLLLPTGRPIVKTIGRLAEENGSMDSERAPLLVGIPKAILVDSLTASTAEIFAGALKGCPDVEILGEATYGKRSIQRIRPLSSGGALKVTSAYFLTPADIDTDSGEPRPRSHGSQASGTLEVDPAGTSGRTERLQPDRVLADPRLGEPWSWIERAGLIARFLQEETLTTDDRAMMSFWSGDAERVDWSHPALPVGGYDRWSARLVESLARWGAVVDRPAGGATGPLRRYWLVDWAAERWGEDVAARARVELDPWVMRAIPLLVERKIGTSHPMTAAS